MYGEATRLESSINHLKHSLARAIRKIKYEAARLVLYFSYSTRGYALTYTKIEAVQRRAARFCLNEFSCHSSVTSMLSTLNLPPLQQRRERAELIMMYKIINDLIYIPKDYFTPNDSRLRKGYYRQLTTNIDSYKFSFPPSVIKLWNPLPPI